LVDLQFGHLMLVDIGLPQLGQFSAESDISFLQSEQVINGMQYSFGNLNLREILEQLIF